MGYRAHIVTQERKYGSSVFCDFTQFEDYVYKLHELYPDDEIYQSESQDFFEIGKSVVEKEIKRLEELGAEEDFEFKSTWGYSNEKNSEVISLWKEALEQAPKKSNYIGLEWY